VCVHKTVLTSIVVGICISHGGSRIVIISCIVLTSATVLSLIWHIPVRFVSLDTFIVSLGLIAYLMLLATLAFPAIAVTFAAIFNASLF
jgi:hypothetical protein